MIDLEELRVKITGDSSSFQGAMKGALGSLSEFGIDVGKMGPLLGAAGLVGLFSAAAKEASEMQKAFAEAETSQLRFNAACAASGNVTGAEKTALEKLAASFAQLAGMDDDAILGQEAMLVATGRTTEQVGKMLPAALGYANAAGISFNTALEQLNKTFSGSIGRMGQMTPELQGLTKEQLASGAAVDVVLGKYGALSGALADSAQTSMANYETALGNIKEGMGELIEQDLRPIRDGLTGAFKWLAENENRIKATLGVIEIAIVAIVAAINPIAGAVAGTIAVIANLYSVFTQSARDAEKAAKDLAMEYGKLEDPIQKRARLEREAGAAAAQAAHEAAEAHKAATDKIIAGRKEAEKEYVDSLARIETKVRLGLMTEEEAAKAKYEANKDLVEKLIELGYTGSKKSGQIGDKALADAIDRTKDYERAAKNGLASVEVAEIAHAQSVEIVNARLLQARLENLNKKEVAEEAAAAKAEARLVAAEVAEYEHAKAVEKTDANLLALRLQKVEIRDKAEEAAAEAAERRRVAEEIAETARLHAAQQAEERLIALRLYSVEKRDQAEAAAQAAAEARLIAAEIAETAHAKAVELTDEKLLALRLENLKKREDAEEKAEAGAEARRIAAEIAETARIRAAELAEERLLALRLANLKKREDAEELAAEAAEKRAQDAEIAEIARIRAAELAEERLLALRLAKLKEREDAEEAAAKAAEDRVIAAEIAEIERERLAKITEENLLAIRLNSLKKREEAEEAAEEAAERRRWLAEVAEAEHAEAVAATNANLLALRLENLKKQEDAEDAAIEAEEQRVMDAKELHERLARRRLELAEGVHIKEDAQEKELADKKRAYWDSYYDYIVQKNKEIEAEHLRTFGVVLQSADKIFGGIAELIKGNSREAQQSFIDAAAKIAGSFDPIAGAALTAFGKMSSAVHALAQQLNDAIFGDYSHKREIQTMMDYYSMRAQNAQKPGEREMYEAKKEKISYLNKALQISIDAEEAYKGLGIFDSAGAKRLDDLYQAYMNALAAQYGETAFKWQRASTQGVISGAIDKLVKEGLALGGIALGGATVVGERGVELVSLPTGARVYNNQETKNILNQAAGHTFVFNSPKALSPREQRAELRRLSRRLAFEGLL